MPGRDEELAEIDALFAQADLDHDGQINFTEFKTLVREARWRHDGSGTARRIH
jgi:Ca2+-binding EF-hand superfamily protein